MGPAFTQLGEGIGAAFTTRVGGISAAPFAGLNLGLHVGDDAQAVRHNRVVSARALGLDADRVTWAEQVHGAGVAMVTQPDVGRGAHELSDAIPAVDALVTAERAVPLAILVADCVPILLADPGQGVVGAVHAGRRGLVAGVVPRTVERLVDLGARRGGLLAAVGPAIGPCCYDVGDDVYAEVTTMLPTTAARSRSGGHALDLVAGVHDVLAREGVTVADSVTGCTSCQPGQWFSHRRDGVTGRMAAVVWRM